MCLHNRAHAAQARLAAAEAEKKEAASEKAKLEQEEVKKLRQKMEFKVVLKKLKNLEIVVRHLERWISRVCHLIHTGTAYFQR